MLKAMVVDDSRAIRMILGRTLAKLGYEVSAAANGREAVEALMANPEMSLVLVDWNMPEMTGIDFIRTVRAHREHDGTAIMMVTTETQAEQMIEALEAGADEYVMKPFTEDIIADKIRLIGSKRGTAPIQAGGGER